MGPIGFGNPAWMMVQACEAQLRRSGRIAAEKRAPYRRSIGGDRPIGPWFRQGSRPRRLRFAEAETGSS